MIEKIITRNQLEKLLSLKAEVFDNKRLGELCVDIGLIGKNELRELIKKYQTKMLLGELFINIGLITEKDLDKALSKQEGTKKRLGEVLIEMGIISEEELARTLSIQLDIPKTDPEISLIDKALLKKVNEKYLKKNLLIPAYKEKEVLTLIMADPFASDDIEHFSKIFSCRVQPSIATKSTITRALYELYDKPEVKEKEDYIANTGHSKELFIGDVKYAIGQDKVIDIVNYLISCAIMEDASDIHIEPQTNKLRVRFRIDGVLHHKTDLPIALAPALSSRVKVLCGLDIAEKRKHQDGRISAEVLGKEIDLRVATCASIYGEAIVLRVLQRHSKLIDLNHIGFSPNTYEQFEKIINYPSGIMLVSGPTGSGKTTTLYASLNYLNDLKRKIITVEDPIEYTLPGVIQGNINPKIGLSYVDFLKSMMRQDPDVLMIGEIRERESAEITIQAALTGHKVFSTFHTDDTTGALIRLMDMGIETFLISSTIVSVLSQRLIRIICRECKEKYTPPVDILRAFQLKEEINLKKYHFYKGKGCHKCNNTGFRGRIGIFELLVLNDDIRNAILNRESTAGIRKIAREKVRLVSMREDGFYKALKGITTLEEVLRVVFYNESDECPSRNTEDIIRLCESGKKKTLKKFNKEDFLTQNSQSRLLNCL